mmetsp:Transcript_42536/g.68333  ORF Transcript_42536/g.68333 Transcript_42536/m.68333 type:complete len:119 (+) Transcript_42536:454-810(+)
MRCKLRGTSSTSGQYILLGGHNMQNAVTCPRAQACGAHCAATQQSGSAGVVKRGVCSENTHQETQKVTLLARCRAELEQSTVSWDLGFLHATDSAHDALQVHLCPRERVHFKSFGPQS